MKVYVVMDGNEIGNIYASKEAALAVELPLLTASRDQQMERHRRQGVTEFRGHFWNEPLTEDDLWISEHEVLSLREDENAALRRELLDQWESNHSEHCGAWGVHESCKWPPPELIRDEPSGPEFRGWPYPVTTQTSTSSPAVRVYVYGASR